MRVEHLRFRVGSRRLIALEEHAAAVHAELVAATPAPEIAQFFAELARQDREHRDLLAGL